MFFFVLHRYWHGGTALNAVEGGEGAGRCAHCGSARVYELQVLPYLMSCLQPSGGTANEHDLDWATVCVYTCGRSCWAHGDVSRDEHVVVQLDPDAALFRRQSS